MTKWLSSTNVNKYGLRLIQSGWQGYPDGNDTVLGDAGLLGSNVM